MAGAGLHVESAKGECNLGQHEIVFRYDDALITCDNHAVYKTGAKEIAAEEGMSLTFMAKVNEREGNSCHVHLSLREAAATRGAPVLADGESTVEGRRALPRRPARDPARAHPVLRPEHQLLQALPGGLVRPDRRRMGHRQPHVRAPARRARTVAADRVPGAGWRRQPVPRGRRPRRGGLHGIEQELPLPDAFVGNVYESELPRVPSTLREAAALWSASTFARSVFGDDVVDHYANMARVELAAFDAAVTNWELYRGFERL